MLVFTRSLSRDVVRLSCLGTAAAFLFAIPGSAQQTAQPAPRVMYLSCAYVQGTVFYMTGVFTVPANQIGAAKSAFRQYALSQSGNQPIRDACRVAPNESSLQAARQSDRSAVAAQSGKQAKIKNNGWRFTPSQSAVTQPSYGPTGRYSQTVMPNSPAATTYRQQTGASNQNNASASYGNYGNANGSTGTTNSSPVAGVTSSMTQAGQSMKDNAVNAGTAVTSGVTQAATDATTQLQQSVADKIGSLFHRGQPKTNTNQAQQVAPTAAATPTMLVAENTETAAPVETAPSTASSSGPSFATCHADAGATEYVSEVFPVMEPDDTKIRYAFWQVVGRQHKGGPVAYSAESCSRAASEGQATSLRGAVQEAATKRGVAASQIINTGWSYMGQ